MRGFARGPARVALGVCLAVEAIGFDAAMAANDDGSGPRPSVRALFVEDGPVVDGRLDDDVWQRAEKATGFVQREPREGRPASERTEVSIVYTSSRLFVAVLAHDSEPEKVIAKEMARDGRLFVDDSITLVFDTFLDGRNSFSFSTNANGARGDALVTDEGRDINRNWDGVWAVSARRSAQGWVAELAIPFSTLRFDPSLDTWGFNIERNLRRKREEAHWAPMSLESGDFGRPAVYRVSLAGALTGLEGLRPSRSLDVIPYVSAEASEQPPTGSSDEEIDGGLDVKWGITRSLALDFTYNTDFAEVEVDDLRVNLTRFSLFFPEKRDFFLENAGIFDFGPVRRLPWEPTLMKGFFSRRIGLDGGETVPIEGGARLTGRIGEWNVGFLGVGTEETALDDRVVPQTGFAVARAKRNLGERSSIGALVTERNPDGSGPERLLGIDFEYKPTQRLEFAGFASKTDIPGVEDEDGSFGAGFGYSGPVFRASLDLLEAQEGFDPSVGFLLREDFRLLKPRVEWQPRIERGGIRNWYAEAGYERFERSGTGELESDRLAFFPLGMGLESNDFWQAGALFGTEVLFEPFEIVPGVVIPPGVYETEGISALFSSDFSRPVSIDTFVDVGDFYDGEWVSASTGIRLRISRFFSASTQWSHNDVELPHGDFEVNLWSQGFDVSFTPDLRLNMIAQHNDADEVVGVNVRFHWIYRPGADLFVVYNENWTAPSLSRRSTQGRQLIVKITYLFRR